MLQGGRGVNYPPPISMSGSVLARDEIPTIFVRKFFPSYPSQPCLTLPALVNSRWRTETGSSYKLVKRYQRHSFRACPIHFNRYRHRPTSKNSIRYKSEVETVRQTGSTNNLTTETDIDAISVAIPMFWGQVFHWFI